MTIDIICPLYKAENYILDIVRSINNQKDVDVKTIRFILTESNDKSEDILKENDLYYSTVSLNDFSHSKTREDEAMKSDADILVFITQDIVIQSDVWLKNLVSPIINGECEASFSRQLSKYNNIEKYTREKNYPDKSYINSKEDIETKGLKTFFFSDASSAIKTSIYKELGGYDGKVFPTNEDMYIAHKLITNGYKIKYCADSEVYHSHKFTLKEVYKRYYITGEFMAMNPQIESYGTTKAGGGLAKYILKRAIKEFNIKVLIRFFPDMMARFIGMKKGKKKYLKKLKKENKAKLETKN
ncbi:MAG: glycosyltransferase family 2 protein [Clostridia bacterium]|nr:glycosyltransferase family 2 protein [Clostridia bacterium]